MRRALALVLVLVAGCSQPLTELVVGLGTDVADPADPLATVRLTVTNVGTGRVLGDKTWTLAASGVHLPDAYVIFTTDDSAPLLRLDAVGTLLDASTIVRTAVVGLTPRTPQFLRLLLAKSCLGKDASYCGGSTCIEGACTTPSFAAGRLPGYVAGAEKQFPCNSGTAVVDTATGVAIPLGAGCPSNATCIEDTCYAAAGASAATCQDGEKDGFETDVDCGGPDCDDRCGQGQFCSTGSDCVSLVCDDNMRCACPPHFAACDGTTCADLDNDVYHCGDCATACPSGDLCASGACVLRCQDAPVPLTLCNGQCVDFAGDADHCGGCGIACPPGYVCSAGTCAASCQMGLTACPVSPPGDGGIDEDGGLAPDGGAGDGGVVIARDVCVNLRTDVANCSACGVTCPAGFVCDQGKCALSCPAGLHACDGKCVDWSVDPRNCGMCDNPCGQAEQCRLGACRSLCSGLIGLPGPPLLAEGKSPFGVWAGDFNGDGLPDFAVTLDGASTLQVHLNRGDGSFASAGANIATGAGPGTLVGGDWNRDGKTDLAVMLSAGVGLLLGNGDGTFQPVQALAFAGVPMLSPRGAAAGDLDGDGNLDLVIANGTGNDVIVLLGKGDGTFAAPTMIANFVDPQRVALGDLDGDGKLDLAVTSYGSSNVSVLLGAGDGSFGGATSYKTPAAPWQVALADLNGDGKLDMAVACETANAVAVFFNKGAGAFAPSFVSYPVGTGPRALVTADVNGDHFVDVIAGNHGSGTVSVLLGSKTGALAPAVAYRAASVATDFAAGDWNGDGKLDLATVSNDGAKLDLTLGRGDGSFVAPPALVATGNVNQGPVVMTAIADLNADGVPDLVGAGSPLTVWLGKGGGAFSPGVAWRHLSASTPVVLPADWNGDGKIDLVAPGCCANGTFLAGNGDGTFTGEAPINVGRGTFAAVDFNLDGKLDVVAADLSDPFVWVYFGNGNGTFKTPLVPAGSAPNPVGGMAVADLDRDGRPDVVVSSLQAQAAVFLGGAGGTLKPAVQIATTTPAKGLAIADVDGDGKLDLVLALQATPAVGISLGNGDGTFKPMQMVAAGANSPAAVAVADVDGDGRLDLVLTYQTSLFAVLFGTGGGAFQPVQFWSSGNGSLPAATADLDGDGTTDVVVTNRADNAVSVHLNQGLVCGR